MEMDMVRVRRVRAWLAVCVGVTVIGSGAGPRADGPQAPPTIEHYRLVPGFLPEQYNDDGMAVGTGFASPNPWGAYTAYLLATNGKGQRTWRIENYLPNTNAGTAQGSSMYLFEGSSLALLVDTAQNTPDEPGRTDLKTVVRHLLSRENDGTTPRSNPVDFVVANTHSHGDHTGKNSTMSDRTLYYPELDWPANGAPANYTPIKEAGGPSPRGNGQAAADVALGDRTITAIDLNQHTRGSTGYFDRENRMIATGDAIGSAYVWAHFGTMTQYARVVRHLQAVLQPFDHVDVLPAHFYQIKQGARGRPPLNGRPLDKRYVDDQVRAAEAILAGTVVSEPYRAVGRNAVIATVDSAQVVHSLGNMWPIDAPPEARYPGVWRAVTIPGPLPVPTAGDRFAGLRNITSRFHLIRGEGAATVYLITGSTRALLIGTGAGSPGLAALAGRLTGAMPLDVVVTSDDAGQVGGLAQFTTSVLYLPEGVAAPAGATQVRRLRRGSRIDLGLDPAGRPLVFEVHPLTGHSATGITLLHVGNRLLFAGDALGMQGPDAGLILREPLAAFAAALAEWRAATNGRYDVVYTAGNYQWFTAPAYVDQVQEAVTRGLGGGEAVWIDSTQRPGMRIVRSGGAADIVASILVESR
jgi:glyoxylase-like metal-dependent hydrolase (beta-lactamase superfamily II)